MRPGDRERSRRDNLDVKNRGHGARDQLPGRARVMIYVRAGSVDRPIPESGSRSAGAGLVAAGVDTNLDFRKPEPGGQTLSPWRVWHQTRFLLSKADFAGVKIISETGKIVLSGSPPHRKRSLAGGDVIVQIVDDGAGGPPSSQIHQ